MRRIFLAVGLVVALALAAPAAGAQPQRGCPPAFDEATIPALVSMWPQFDPADFEAFLLVIDANANGELCWAPFRENSAKFGEPFFVANFIDDVSNVPH
jgi:hypothetical protein